MTNFDFLKNEPRFKSFADTAISAEKILYIDPSACVLNCRRAMEFAVKWMYSVDQDLHIPFQDTLYNLMHSEDFKDIICKDVLKKMDYIRLQGNNAAHKTENTPIDVAKLCLENLYYFLDEVAYLYAADYTQKDYDVSLLNNKEENFNVSFQPDETIDLQKLIEENKQLKEELTKRREIQLPTYVPKPLDISEYDTRKLYIDQMLRDVGWIEGKDWINEVAIKGMPNKKGIGYADYVLYDNSAKPLAIIEAKKTCVDVSVGRQQASLYADLLEKEYHRRPVIFLTNGFDTRIIDGQYPERKVSGIYSKRDLEKLFNLKNTRLPLMDMQVDTNIAGRYYQQAAVKAVCEAFDTRNRRKALLVMATGSGKTRAVIGLVKLLLEAGWIKNVLFLADRNALVTQAKRAFANNMRNLSLANLCEDREYTAHCIFSTYNTMMNCIDSVKYENNKLYTPGHFDLIICDEAHRSIYNKYQDIFNYFDAPLVGLTATPKDEIDKNTYDIFELEHGIPTYGYELAQAVKDGYLVDYLSVETTLKFLFNGITYDDLSKEDQEKYEDTFKDEEGNVPETIDSSALNSWIFNEDTIKKVLNQLMTDGIHIDYGNKIGKTIIFAKNHLHAEMIYKVFNKEYPSLNGYAKVIDNHINYAQSAIDEYSDSNKLPMIAISVDMLDTGIDVPEIVNLVFFKKVMSKAKFWQMIGRGTRLSPMLIDGKDKEYFYIFDYCGNFEFFRNNPGKATPTMNSLQGAIFKIIFEIVYKLQDFDYQTEKLKEFRKELVEYLVSKINQLNKDNFAVRQHLKYVDLYSNPDSYNSITYLDTLTIQEELVPLILPDNDEINAIRFDALLYGLELADLAGKKYGRAKTDLIKKVEAVSSIPNIPEIQMEAEFLTKLINTNYIEQAGIFEFEEIRIKLRSLMKYIQKNQRPVYETNFKDDILSSEWHESELESDDLKNYKAKVEYYVKQHQDNIVISKIKENRPLDHSDIEFLEDKMWNELGSKEEYKNEYGDKPLGEFVREIVGLDMNAAKEAFAIYLNDSNLNINQIYFINQVVEYIVKNGLMKDLSVLQDSPFTDKGSIVDLFSDDLSLWAGIRNVIESINTNALYN